MPIYEYRCGACGATFDKLTRMGTTDAPACPSCGAAGAERRISVVASRAAGCGAGAFT